MTASEKRLVPSALIPWVFALVALFGCNALAPNPVAVRKGKYADGSSVSQVAAVALPVGTISTPLVFLAPDPSDGIKSKSLSSTRLAIESGRELAVVTVRSGEVQGRAPPMLERC